MAIIYSYPTVTPTTDDLLLGTDVNGTGKPTKNFSIASIITLIQGNATGLGAVLTLSNDAQDLAGVNQSAVNFLNIQGTGTFTAGTFTDGTMTINTGVGTGFTSIASTDFTGDITGIVKDGSSIQTTVTGVTQVAGNNSTRLATTAYVDSIVDPSVLTFLGGSGGAQTVNLATQTFSVLGTTSEIKTAGTAQTLTVSLADGAFGSGAELILPDGASATTQATTDDTTKVATTAFVQQEITSQDLDFSGTAGTGAVDLNSQVFAVTGTANQISTAAAAQGLAIALTSSIQISGTYTGATFAGDLNGTINTATTGTTQGAGNDSTLIATTAYVDNAAGAKLMQYIGDTGGPFDLNLTDDDFKVAGGTNITSVATTVAANIGAVTVNLDDDVTLSGFLQADNFKTTAGTATWVTTVLAGFTSMTSTTFIADGTASVTDFQGNASSATKLGAADGTITLSAGAGATLGVGSDSVIYTNGGNITLTTTLAASTVTGKLLTGVSFSTGTAVVATDTILEGVGKLQKQITDLPAGLDYIGTWDASGGAGGTPDLTAVGTHIPGQYYIVATAGNARPNGAATEPSEWKIGDWVIRADATLGEWSKIDNTSEVTTDGSGVAGIIPIWNNASEIGASQIQDLTVVGRTVTTIVDGGTGGDLTVQGHTVLGSAVGDTVTVKGPATFEAAPNILLGLGANSSYGSATQVLTSGGSSATAMTWTTPTTGVVESITGGPGIVVSGTAAIPIVSVDYIGVDNIVLSAAAAVTPVGGDTIIINDVTDGDVKQALISTLPFVPAVSGTQYTLPMFATTTTLGDSMVSQNAGATEATVTGILDVTSYVEVGPDNMRIVTGDNSIFISSRTTAPGVDDVQNTALGNAALNSLANTSGALGNDNVAVGYRALEDLTTGYYNTAIGSQAGGAMTTAFACIAIGYQALDAATTNNNSHCIAIGHGALGALNDPTSNAGIYNIAIGNNAAQSRTTGKKNIHIGGNAAYQKTTGDSNLYIGNDTSPGVGTPTQEIAIGDSCPGNGSYTITLGSNNSTVFYGSLNGIDIGSTSKPWGDIYSDGTITAQSSSAGDYVRMYGAAGTGKWDIYGNGANLRITDNESAGLLAVDAAVTIIDSSDPSNLLKITVDDPAVGGSTTAGFLNIDGGTAKLYIGQSGGSHFGIPTGGAAYIYNNNTVAGSKLAIGNITNTDLILGTNNAANLTVKAGGMVQLNTYGSGSRTGTATYNLEVDTSGNVIETPSGGGGGGIFYGDKVINSSTTATAFTLQRSTGTLIFDVWLTSQTSTATSVAKKYVVAHSYGTTPVYNKIIDTGPDGSNDFTVTFVNAGTGGDSVNCSIISNSIAAQTIGYTVQVGNDSTNTLTFTAG